MATSKARINTAPWLAEIFNGRVPTKEEVQWMVKQLFAAQECEDETALRILQRELATVLGIPLH